MKILSAVLVLVVSLSACHEGPSLMADAAMDLDAADDLILPTCEGKIGQPLDANWTIVSGGIERTLLVHVPAQYDPSRATPVVLSFHGFTSNAAQQQILADMDGKADSEGFISVHPNGTGAPRSWNAGACCGDAVQEGTDDVQFVRDMLSELENRLCIDQTRIYATGMSNGGFMSHRLACDLSDRIAAIAPVAGHSVQALCEPGRPVPVTHFHGTLDAVVPYAGNAGQSFPPVQETMDAWAQRNGCGSTSEEVYRQGDARCLAYAECPVGGQVTLCTIDGGGHTWPGGLPVPGLGKTSSDISATDVMWDFFEQQQLVPGQ